MVNMYNVDCSVGLVESYEVVWGVGSTENFEFTGGKFVEQVLGMQVADDCLVDVEDFSFFIFNQVVCMLS